jgi:cell division protein ZapA (FtsZ GTPase activity inhibitor)
MKNKYTLNIANSDISIITEESKETIDAIVSTVDHKIREIYLHSKGRCSRTDAAILVCLDYCAERMELQKTFKSLNAEIDRLTMVNELAEKEKAALEREIETLRATINAPKASAKNTPEGQIGFDEISNVENVAEEPVVEKLAEETLTPPLEAEKPTVKLKKKKVRAMFDMISFDDI